jgi:hypothetical protein
MARETDIAAVVGRRYWRERTRPASLRSSTWQPQILFRRATALRLKEQRDDEQCLQNEKGLLYSAHDVPPV